MLEFAANTRLKPPSPNPRRYLWTDSFAVATFFELHKRTQDTAYKELALNLVDQVHETLGKYRPDDREGRRGWISGLKEEEGQVNPTKGGLRIGKKLPEQLLQKEHHYDDDEWDRDGQYFHYLTKWMQALCLVTSVINDTKYLKMAAEMAKGVHYRFTYQKGSGTKSMYWKMSIDLSRPVVPSMGHHDPLDGFITYYTIQQQLASYKGMDDCSVSLDKEMADLYSIIQGQDMATSDPLGLGGLLFDIARVFQLCKTQRDVDPLLQTLLTKLTQDTLTGLQHYNSKRLDAPAEYRLAFRELGLSIGLQAVHRMKESMAAISSDHILRKVYFNKQWMDNIDQILAFHHLVDKIHEFWMKESNRSVESWTDHLDINMVMLASSLLPPTHMGM